MFWSCALCFLSVCAQILVVLAPHGHAFRGCRLWACSIGHPLATGNACRYDSNLHLSYDVNHLDRVWIFVHRPGYDYGVDFYGYRWRCLDRSVDFLFHHLGPCDGRDFDLVACDHDLGRVTHPDVGHVRGGRICLAGGDHRLHFGYRSVRWLRSNQGGLQRRDLTFRVVVGILPVEKDGVVNIHFEQLERKIRWKATQADPVTSGFR